METSERINDEAVSQQSKLLALFKVEIQKDMHGLGNSQLNLNQYFSSPVAGGVAAVLAGGD